MLLLDLIFPNRCLHCNRIIGGNDLVCELCLDQIYFSHHHFLETNPLKERCSLLFPVENAFALMYFEQESLGRKILHQLKYGNREKVGKILAKWISEKLDFGEKKPDLLVIVPLHPKKLKERGYNQLHLFTKTLAQNFDIPFDPILIKRNFYRKAQAKKNKAQRNETENLFSVTKDISGKHILLIDDVFTTGNTISSIAWEILKSSENVKISILVMAMDV